MARRSLAEFVRQSWHVLEPGNRLLWNWHLDALSEHLEAVTRGQLRLLAIAMPPGMLKSITVSVAWPAWEWVGNPEIRSLFGSYAMDLAIRDSVKCRDLIESEWYQTSFGPEWGVYAPGWEMRDDQNAKSYFENTRKGFRFALSVGSRGTGFRGHKVVADDPLNAKEAYSETARAEVVFWWDKVMYSRVNDLATGARVIVMQRLHEGDLIGHVEAKNAAYEILRLPAEFDPRKRSVTCLWQDPREAAGEPLFPALLPAPVLADALATLGSADYSAQYNQEPIPAAGLMFNRAWFRIVDEVPVEAKRVRYWDKAGTERGGAYTAGVKVARHNDITYIEDVVRGQWASHDRNEVIKGTAETDGKTVDVWVEQEPGSGGKESAEITVRDLAGYVVHIERVTGDKASRARPLAAQAEARNVRLKRGDWNEAYLSEMETFPVGRYKDQVDGSSGGFNKLALPPPVRPAVNPVDVFASWTRETAMKGGR